MTQTPTYFRVIHGWNVQWVGWLSGLPHFLRMSFAYFFSKWCDSMLRQNKISRTNIRKLACALCTSINSIFVLALAFSGCNTWMAVACVTSATMIHGAVSTGPLANVIDIAPNYSGIILGLTGTVSVFPGFISPYIVGKLTLNNVSPIRIHSSVVASPFWYILDFRSFLETANGATMAIRIFHRNRVHAFMRSLLPNFRQSWNAELESAQRAPSENESNGRTVGCGHSEKEGSGGQGVADTMITTTFHWILNFNQFVPNHTCTSTMYLLFVKNKYAIS